MLEKLAGTLSVGEFSRPGRSIAEVIALINEPAQPTIRVIVSKQRPVIARLEMNSKIIATLSSLFAGLERDLTSMRTRRQKGLSL